MKKNLTLLALLGIMTWTIQAQVQYPINGGMEEWTTSTFSGGVVYDSLVGWDTPQRLASILAPNDTVTFRTDVANSGSSAALLISKEVTIAGLLTVVVPGSISTGTFFVDLFSQEFGVNGGAPIDCKPTTLSGFYQYQPVGADTCNALVTVFDAAGNEIADEILSFPNATSGGYQPFSMNINYTSMEDPAFIQVTFTSSGTAGNTGSSMWVDDVVLSGGDCVTGLFDAFSQPAAIELMPNPASNLIRFDLPLERELPAAVSDLQGRNVLRLTAVPGMNQLDVSSLPAGVYFLRIADQGRTVYASKFEKF